MRLLVAAFAILGAMPASAAWFTDNGDRAPLAELRAKPETELSATESAILTAANRTGWIELPGCGWGSNAVLVTVDGQDYAVTSLHLLTGKGPGDVHCEPDLGGSFMPNAAYIAPEEAGVVYDSATDSAMLAFQYRSVELLPDPVNFTRAGAGMPWVADWVAYRLAETVSGDIMPEGTFGAGSPRGAMPWSARQNPTGPVWVIGYDGRFGDENGWQFSWHGCEQRRMRVENGLLYFSCDVSPGASSSLIAVMEAGELTFQGIITASMEPLLGTNVALPESLLMWNIGTTSDGIRAKLDPDGFAAAARAMDTKPAGLRSWQGMLPWSRAAKDGG